MADKPIYIHYGSNEYRTPHPIRNDLAWVKPHGGLWASRIDDDLGWKNWCEHEDFCLDSFDKSFKFTLKDGASLLVLSDIDQLDILPTTNLSYKPYVKGSLRQHCCLDFEELMKDYDAVELVDIHAFYWALYGWDCNCILVMNPDIVEVI